MKRYIATTALALAAFGAQAKATNALDQRVRDLGTGDLFSQPQEDVV